MAIERLGIGWIQGTVGDDEFVKACAVVDARVGEQLREASAGPLVATTAAISSTQKPIAKASILGGILAQDGINVSGGENLIRDLAHDMRIEFRLLEREFRLLKLFAIQTAIRSVMNKQPGGRELLDQFQRWLVILASKNPALHDLVAQWNQRRESYSDAWSNNQEDGTAASIGQAFNSACGKHRGHIGDFAGSMFTQLAVYHIQRLRAFLITPD